MDSIELQSASGAINSAAEEFSLVLHPAPILVAPSRCMLIRDHKEQSIEPKAMEVLVELARDAGQVLSREQLLDRVWPGVVVSDQVLTRCISKLRQALGDPSSDSQIIETISKRGYRLIVPVERAWRRHLVRPSGQAASNSLIYSDRLAVMPLAVFGSTEDRGFLGAGISRDLAQLLSQVPGLGVVASVFAERAAQRHQAPQDLGAELDARFIVSGNLELRDEHIRLRLEMTDAHSGLQILARRFDTELPRFFAMQDALVQELARALSTELDLKRVTDIRRDLQFSLEAYEHIQLAEEARRNYDEDAARSVVSHLSAALALEPENGVAHALLAMQLSQNLVSRWTTDPRQTAADSADHLALALQLSPSDSRVLMAAGISSQMRGQHQQAYQYLRRSLEVNPNEPHTLAELGVARYFLHGELAPSIDMIAQAERSAPNHPRYGIWAYRRGICYYQACELESAVEAYDVAIARLPNYHHVHMTKAVALTKMGAFERAQGAISSGLKLAGTMPYSEFEVGVVGYGLDIPPDLSMKLASIWRQALQHIKK